MVKCFRTMAHNHNLSIIISIHQPTLETLMIFDLLYVMAKGGVCVYSGRPQHLRQHMNDCHITLRDNQIPIEVLLKVGANGYNDNSVIELSEKATEDMAQRYRQNMRTEVKHFPNGIPIRSKQFSPREVWYLLVRKLIYTLKRNWILLLTQTGVLIIWTGFTHIQLDFDFEKSFGYLPMNAQNCPKTEESIAASKILRYHMLLIFLYVLFPPAIILSISSLTFWLDLKVFLMEYKNGN